MRIVGDTLGYSEKRRGKTLSAVLQASQEMFLFKRGVIKSAAILCTPYVERKKALTAEVINEVSDLLQKTTEDELTWEDNSALSRFTKLCLENTAFSKETSRLVSLVKGLGA